MSQVRENRPSEQLSEAEASEATRRYLFRRFWSSGLGFWNTRRAWILTISLAGVIILNIGVQYGLNVWNRNFFDALENRNAAAAYKHGGGLLVGERPLFSAQSDPRRSRQSGISHCRRHAHRHGCAGRFR